MASSNVPPQTSSATQPARSTDPTPSTPAQTEPTPSPSNTPGACEHHSAKVSGDGSCRHVTLYFSEVTGETHDPMHFSPDEWVQQIQWRLQEETFRSRCVDEVTNNRMAHVELLTTCGTVLDPCRNLDEYPVCDGDILTVIVAQRRTVRTKHDSQGAFVTRDLLFCDEAATKQSGASQPQASAKRRFSACFGRSHGRAPVLNFFLNVSPCVLAVLLSLRGLWAPRSGAVLLSSLPTCIPLVKRW